MSLSSSSSVKTSDYHRYNRRNINSDSADFKPSLNTLSCFTFFRVFSFVGAMHHSVHTCRVETCALTGVGNTLEVPGNLCGPEERSGENEQ